jgi:hypothetical protein
MLPRRARWAVPANCEQVHQPSLTPYITPYYLSQPILGHIEPLIARTVHDNVQYDAFGKVLHAKDLPAMFLAMNVEKSQAHNGLGVSRVITKSPEMLTRALSISSNFTHDLTSL